MHNLLLPAYGVRLAGNVTALYYSGTTSGVFAGGIGESLIFSVAGSWTFFTTGPIQMTIKGAGAGGGGLGTTYEAGVQAHAYGGGGGGAYHLGLSYLLLPGVVYELTIGAAASGTATLLKIQGGSDILQLGAGGPPTGVNMATGGVGGTSSAGSGSTGGAGGNTNNAGSSTSGTGGGGSGGGGNLGGTGGTNGFTGGNGESAGVAGAAAGAFTGGDGGYGGGITLADATTGYGRGAGGGGDEAGVSEVTPVNADKAKQGAMQFTRA